MAAQADAHRATAAEYSWKAETLGRRIAAILHRWRHEAKNPTLKLRDYVRIGLITACCMVAAPVLNERAHNPEKRSPGQCFFLARVPLIGWPLLACDTPLNDIATLLGVTMRSRDESKPM
jgi:hypothetical protein